MSGLAVAERLGAGYPFGHDRLASAQFDMFLGIAHGRSRKKQPRSATVQPDQDHSSV